MVLVLYVTKAIYIYLNRGKAQPNTIDEFTSATVMAKLRVAIIGAGASGLTSIKCCVDEGLEPVCFEREDYIGGMWNYTEDPNKTSSVYKSTVINTSKETMCFSDFPMPEDFPCYTHNTFVVKYFKLYAENFGLLKYIRFKRKVLEVKRAPDFATNGQWVVKTQGEEGDVVSETFDAVMLCVGHHSKPSWPNFKGMDLFTGIQMHSNSYKTFHGFEDKTVLVVGIGNSGGDIAVELSRHAKQVYLSTRSGTWVFSRLAEGGLPIAYAYNTRFFTSIPLSIRTIMAEKDRNKAFCHKTFGLEPAHSIFSQHPMLNDALPTSIITGTCVIKPNVTEFTKDGVVFDNGTSVDKLDAVIFATGYKIQFPFLEIEKEIVDENKVNLYKYVFPPFLEKPTLAVIGNIQPLGAINPISELQARWVCGVLNKTLKLPTRDEMEKDICMRREAMKKRYYSSKRHTIQVDYLQYCDELAEMVGCKPNILKMFFTDPVLAYACYFKGCTPCQFRLTGPSTWAGARQAIMEAEENLINVTKTRMVKAKEQSFSRKWFKLFAFIVLCFAIFYKIFT